MSRIKTKDLEYEYIEELWLKHFNRNDILSLYIDVPFCMTVCKFCNLGRFQARVCSDEYNEYFEKTLPRQFEVNKNILRMKVFDTLYFGGGTSGMMDTKVMRKVFDMIPNINKIKYKKFEANPTLLSKEKIDILIEYGFNEVSLGVQSFNDDLIKANNRIPVKKEKLRQIIDLCHKGNIRVNCDLLTFTEQSGYTEQIDIKKSLKNTYNDVLIMASEVEPDYITVYPKWEMFSYDKGEFKEDLKDRDLGVRYEINKMILRAFRKIENYRSRHISSLNLDVKSTKNITENIILTHKGLSKVDVRYDSSSFPFNKGNNQNTIALGGYGGEFGRRPYSYIQGKICYETIGDGDIIRYRELMEEEQNEHEE